DILKAFGSEHGVGKHFYSSTFTLTVLRTKLEVFVYKVKLECAYGINLCDNYISQPVKMEVKKVSRTQHDLKSCNGKDVIALSCDVENAKNVVVRHWKNGDRFRPFGMKGSKLLSDLFTDLKLSEREKQEVWVMEADGDIIWVIGHRASALYKVGADDDAYFVVSLCK
ncbi:MAG: tRNA lysidine(34) synthetase TilS, partial [Sodaliphilus sp.]|nr:tRNA lysidine(34) synthetase TilS [Sodaliphilus sp.]